MVASLLGVLLVGLIGYQLWLLDQSGTSVNTIVVEPASTTLKEARALRQSSEIFLPVSGSAPIENVTHTIPIEEIKLGCPRQDCIPSIENPTFITPAEAAQILPEQSIGIALQYKGEERFYPFPMLETRELVNDVVAGDPLLVSYCPLCGTGIVFDRRVEGDILEFGVSGMLWQSNLLMYNRADTLRDRNLWSQVLGEAVVGDRAGTELTVIPSDIMRFTDWVVETPNGVVLNSGAIQDPYGGEYYSVAQFFEPNFDSTTSPLPPMEYVFGIVVNETPKAYPRRSLPIGVTTDTLGGQQIQIEVTEHTVIFRMESGDSIPDVEGFWFSWAAAHPNTELWP